MVDAAASFDGKHQMATITKREAPVQPRTVSVKPADGEALDAYENFARIASFAPAQSPAWTRGWVEQTAADGIIASLAVDGRAVLALPLEIVSRGPFRIARFMGGRHANGNFPALAAGGRYPLDPDTIRHLADAIAAARPDIDLVALERLAPDLDGLANPFLLAPHSESPNPALAVDLSGGFEALMGRVSGKRKRKKHRSQTRKFEAAGGFRRIEALTAEEVERTLAAFFEMKAVRFHKMGIKDVFAEEDVRRFFRTLFTGALDQELPAFMLHSLEVDGKLRAVTGSSACGKRLICEFGAIAEDDLAFASPGDFLFFENIQEACNRGFDLYDFSVGDEPYKRLWCDVEIRHFDVLLPLSAQGRGLAFAMRAGGRAKAFVKTNPILWKLTKRLRRRTAVQPAADDND